MDSLPTQLSFVWPCPFQLHEKHSFNIFHWWKHSFEGLAKQSLRKTRLQNQEAFVIENLRLITMENLGLKFQLSKEMPADRHESEHSRNHFQENAIPFPLEWRIRDSHPSLLQQ